MNPKLNAIYIKPSNDQLGYSMKAYFVNGQVTKVFLDSLQLESLWNKARDLTIPAYQTMVLEGYEIEYQSNIGRITIAIVNFHYISKKVKDKMDIMVKNAKRIRETYYAE